MGKAGLDCQDDQGKAEEVTDSAPRLKSDWALVLAQLRRALPHEKREGLEVLIRYVNQVEYERDRLKAGQSKIRIAALQDAARVICRRCAEVGLPKGKTVFGHWTHGQVNGSCMADEIHNLIERRRNLEKEGT